MRRLLVLLAIVSAALTVQGAEPPYPIGKANVLPLALDDDFKFGKTKIFLNDPQYFKTTTAQSINFERQRVNFGAVTSVDRRQRYGHYFTFYWKSKKQADLTVRLEYRQANLGSYVQAKEKTYEGIKGSAKTEFEVIGDDYLNDGRITAWRAVLIEDGRIVGLTQSFLWN